MGITANTTRAICFRTPFNSHFGVIDKPHQDSPAAVFYQYFQHQAPGCSTGYHDNTDLPAQRPGLRVDTQAVMKKQTGFTLIELIIAVVIFGIMAAIAAPNYSSFIRSNRASAAYNTLVGTISLARLEAVKSSRVVSMCISSNQTSCDDTTATEWNNGWIVFSDFDGDGVVDSSDGDTILKTEPATGSGITITSDYTSLLSIAPRGRLRKQGSFVICDGSGEDENGRALNLWVTGLGRMATDSDTDTDTIVETISGTNIDCSPSTTTTSD